MLIGYPSKEIERCITSRPLLNVVKCIAFGRIKDAVSKMASCTDFEQYVKQWIVSKVKKEAKTICRKKIPSVLQKTDPQSLLSLSDQTIVSELQEKAPILHTVLRATAVSQKWEQKIKMGKCTDVSIPGISMAASVVLKSGCSYLCAQAIRIGFVLHHSGAKKLVS